MMLYVFQSYAGWSEVDSKPEAAAAALASPLQEVNDSNLCH
jgi:hypothetical protein